MLLIAYAAVLLLPKRLPGRYMAFGLVWGFASSTLFDFTIGGGLLDFYRDRVNDSDRYELTDLLTYFMFAPFGYLFIYFYDLLKINKKTFTFYVIAWSLAGLGVDCISSWMKMTNYKNGYRMEYDLVVYLTVQTLTAVCYEYLKRREGRDNQPRQA
jgi:hypothetical protein